MSEREVATTDDFYQVLGVARNASHGDIQRAYRRLARRYHPDVNADPAAEQRFREITAAYRVLSDPVSRARYDRGGTTGRRVRVNTGGAGGSRGGPPGGSRSGGRRFAAGAGDLDIEDLLAGYFGAGRRGGFDTFGSGGFGRAATSGADVESEIEISVEDAYTGGRGQATINTAAGVRHCDVILPAGVTDGQRIRIPGLGASDPGGGPSGDLYLVVRLAPHPRYRVTGRDLIVDLPVTPWEAVLGGRVAVDTPGGRVHVDLPADSSTGRRLRLPGRGLPNPDGPSGDLYAEVKIVIASRWTAAERALFQRLAEESRFDPRAP
jgi:curved DNA-binding protein